MPYTIRIVGTATTELAGPVPFWLAAADVNANEGRGKVLLTPKRDEALTFPSQLEAFEFWRQQSDRYPLAPNGRPNRPLTAYTVEIEEH